MYDGATSADVRAAGLAIKADVADRSSPERDLTAFKRRHVRVMLVTCSLSTLLAPWVPDVL